MNSPLNGNLVVSGRTTPIARESDFRELLAFETPQFLAKAEVELHAVCSKFGEVRSPAHDLYRQRLSQLRKHLH